MARRHITITVEVEVDEDYVRDQAEDWLDETIDTLVVACEHIILDNLEGTLATVDGSGHSHGVTYER